MTYDLTTVEDVLRYIQSGNARFAVHSNRTGHEYRYHVREYGTSLLLYLITINGATVYMGVLDSDGTIRITDKSRVDKRAPAFAAFAWFWQQLARYNGNKLPDSVSVIPLSPNIATQTPIA